MMDAEEGAAEARPFPGLARIDLGEVRYEEAAEAMRGWVTECQSGAAGDRLFLLSHSPVVTYGTRTETGDLPGAGTGLPGLPVVAVDRGAWRPITAPGRSSATSSRTSATGGRPTSCAGWNWASSTP
jgi:lipoate-protein ligase B